MLFTLNKNEYNTIAGFLGQVKSDAKTLLAINSVIDAIRKEAVSGLDLAGKTQEEVGKLLNDVVKIDVSGRSLDAIESVIKNEVKSMTAGTVSDLQILLGVASTFRLREGIEASLEDDETQAGITTSEVN